MRRRRLLAELGPFAGHSAIASVRSNRISLVDGRTLTRRRSWLIDRPWRLTYDDGVTDRKVWMSAAAALTDVLFADYIDQAQEADHADD